MDVHAYCPIAEMHFVAKAAGIDPLDQALWQRACERMFHGAHSLLIAGMDGWRTSDGVQKEIRSFWSANKPIWLLEPDSFEVAAMHTPI